jgi:hypothetical protein
MDTTAEPEGGIARPRLSYAAIAEQLLAHRLAQPDLAPAGDNDKTALSQAFNRLAPVFALDHAAAAGEQPRAIIDLMAAGLVEAIRPEPPHPAQIRFRSADADRQRQRGRRSLRAARGRGRRRRPRPRFRRAVL